jgi:undecaprenyl diphosphate synthase
MVASRTSPEDITEEMFQGYLYSNGVPDPDLIIRTGGEMRLSNFLLWQAAYAEFYATPVYWPDFDADEVEKALAAFSERRRRFGKLPTNEAE